MIRYLQRDQIDDQHWDRVVSASGFETVYAHSWYLDACAGTWGALVAPDYEYVMPVAFGKKYGIRYTYQPRFCQQLGVYSEKLVDHEVLGMFLLELKKKFRFGDYAFNEGNRLIKERGREITENTNYILKLGSPYGELKQGYSDNCRRNQQRAIRSGLEFYDDISVWELVQMKMKYDHRKQFDAHYHSLTGMFSCMKEAGHVKAFGVKLKGELCAGALFAYCNKRVHYLLSVSDTVGKENSGMFMVIDRVIQSCAGKEMHLDFEGSNIQTVARFFRGFGADPQIYQRISFNSAAGKLIQMVRNPGRHG
jgi:hypothetical protein